VKWQTRARGASERERNRERCENNDEKKNCRAHLPTGDVSLRGDGGGVQANGSSGDGRLGNGEHILICCVHVFVRFFFVRVFREFFLSQIERTVSTSSKDVYLGFLYFMQEENPKYKFFCVQKSSLETRVFLPHRNKRLLLAARTTKNTRARPEKKKKKKKKNALSLFSFFLVSQNFLSFSLNEETRIIIISSEERERERDNYIFARDDGDDDDDL
jgi:hypothetical protein